MDLSSMGLPQAALAVKQSSAERWASRRRTDALMREDEVDKNKSDKAEERMSHQIAQRLQKERFGHVGGPYDADVTLLLPTDLEGPDYQLLEITINLIFLQDVLDETEAQTRGWTSAALFVDVLLQNFDSAELAPCQRSLGVPGLSDLRENSLDICVKRISHQSFVALGLVVDGQCPELISCADVVLPADI